MKSAEQLLTRPCMRAALVVLASAGLSACSGGGASSAPPLDDTSGMVAEGTWLHISHERAYFGSTPEVGSISTQSIMLTNRSAGDVYEIEQVVVGGADADEFQMPVYRDIALPDGKQLAVEVSFVPITQGNKAADLDIDFNVVKHATDEQNRHEQYYYQGEEQERQRNYDAALSSYDHYADGQPVSNNKRRAAIKLPIIQESEQYGQNGDFELYLEAINARDKGDFVTALARLDSVAIVASDSYLADDALYLRGYIELMDLKQPEAALKTMQAVRKQYPASTYYDTALYSEAVAYQDMGDTVLARRVFEDLKHRHTGGGFETVGLAWPKDNLLSRLWFDRATEALNALESI